MLRQHRKELRMALICFNSTNERPFCTCPILKAGVGLAEASITEQDYPIIKKSVFPRRSCSIAYFISFVKLTKKKRFLRKKDGQKPHIFSRCFVFFHCKNPHLPMGCAIFSISPIFFSAISRRLNRLSRWRNRYR
jgi:hypothetical protein